MLDRDHFFRLYGAEASYFTGKVRPALRYKRIPFVEILATPEVYRDVIRPRTGAAFIPTIVTDTDETLQDTSDIIDWLDRHYPEPPITPKTPVQRIAAYLLELYADEFLLLQGLHYRWSFPESEAKARADFAAHSGAIAQANKFADRVKFFSGLLGITPATIPAIEAHMVELLDALDAHLAEHGYLLGERPSLADYGLIGPFYAHFYLDAVPGRLLRERSLRVCHWIERVNHPDPDARGEWLAGDALAPTLRPILAGIGRDAVPMVLATARAFEQWALAQPALAGEPPRAVGTHAAELRGVAFEQVTSAYTLWMVQRPLDAYRALAPADRAAVDRALAGTGCERLLSYEPRVRLGKERFQLVFAPR